MLPCRARYFQRHLHIVYMAEFTHRGLVTPYGEIQLGQQWFMQWLIAWRHRAITRTYVDLSSICYCVMHPRKISKISITKLHLKIHKNREFKECIYMEDCPQRGIWNGHGIFNGRETGPKTQWTLCFVYLKFCFSVPLTSTFATEYFLLLFDDVWCCWKNP